MGRRPVLIVSHDGFNETTTWRSIVVIPLSTSINQARRGLTAIPIFEGEGGIRQDSVALCHQITTIDKAKLREKLGSLREEQMVEIEGGIKAALDLV